MIKINKLGTLYCENQSVLNLFGEDIVNVFSIIIFRLKYPSSS